MAAQVTITQLPTAGAITGSELVPIVQNGVTVQTTTGAIASGGAGTVTEVSVVPGNGFSGTVTNPTSTPAISISTSVSGMLKGSGTSLVAATANTDYQSPIALTTTGSSGAATFDGSTLNIPQYTGGGGGSGTVTSVSVVSANGFQGSVANATTTPAITVSTNVTGILKGNGTAMSAATAGTDYQAPITLTTTGTSGAATFVGNTLNIPQYTGGGGGSGTVTSVAATVPAFLSVTGSPITTSGTLAISYSGAALPIANGGTALTTTPTNGQLLIGNGTGYSLATLTQGANITITNSAGGITIAGNAGTVTSVAQSFTGGLISVAGSPITSSGTLALTVAGTSGGIPYFSSASTWASSAALTQYGIVYGGGAGAAPVSTAAGTTGQVLTATTGGAPTWASPATSGTVTSVAQSFTGGLISVAGSPITSSGTLALTVAGTSGGIPYFSSASTWATSAALTANALMVGGGAGAAPSTVTTGTGVLTALAVNTGSSGAVVTQGGAIISATTVNDSAGTGYTIGYRQMPQNNQAAAATYTLVLADDGKHVYLTGGTTNTLTVPANSSVAFAIGTVITVVNNNSGSCTITGPASSLQLANGALATSRTLATKGMATMVKVGTDLWYVSGAGVT